MFTRNGKFFNCCCCDYLKAHPSGGGGTSLSMVSMGCIGCAGLFCPFDFKIFVAQRGQKCVPDGSYQLFNNVTELWGTVVVENSIITKCFDNFNNGTGGSTPRTPPLLVEWKSHSGGATGTTTYTFTWRDHPEWGTFIFTFTLQLPGSGCTCCPKTCGNCTSGNASLGITMG